MKGRDAFLPMLVLLALGVTTTARAEGGPDFSLHLGLLRAAEIDLGPWITRPHNSPATSIGISASWPLSAGSPFAFDLGYRYFDGGETDVRNESPQPCGEGCVPVIGAIGVGYHAHAALAHMAWRSRGENRFIGRIGAVYHRSSYETPLLFEADRSKLEGSGSIGVEFGEHWGLEYAMFGADARYLGASYRF